MLHMNTRTYLPLALIVAVLLAAAVASSVAGGAPADPTPRTALGLALRAL